MYPTYSTVGGMTRLRAGYGMRTSHRQERAHQGLHRIALCCVDDAHGPAIDPQSRETPEGLTMSRRVRSGRREGPIKQES